MGLVLSAFLDSAGRPLTIAYSGKETECSTAVSSLLRHGILFLPLSGILHIRPVHLSIRTTCHRYTQHEMECPHAWLRKTGRGEREKSGWSIKGVDHTSLRRCKPNGVHRNYKLLLYRNLQSVKKNRRKRVGLFPPRASSLLLLVFKTLSCNREHQLDPVLLVYA